MNVALVEPVMTGHRPTYLKYYIEAFLKKGHDVYVFCPEESVEEFHLSEEDGAALVFIDYSIEKKKYNRFSTPRNVWRQWRIYSDKVKNISASIDLTFFMSMDTFHLFFFDKLKLLGLPVHKLLNSLIPYMIDRVQKTKWGGIFLTPDSNYYHIFQSKKNVAIGVLEETVTFEKDDLNKKVVAIPDITDTALLEDKSVLEKEVIKRAAGRQIITLVGRIHKRKSVITFLNAAEQLEEDFFFLIAGESAFDSFTEDELKRLQKREGKNFYIYPHRVHDGHEFNSLLRCSSMVFASYMNFPHSSNMLTKCARFKKPMIVTKNTYMASMVEKYNMGTSISQGSVTEAVKAIRDLGNDFDVSNARFEAYYEQHKVDRIDDVVNDIIELHRKK